MPCVNKKKIFLRPILFLLLIVMGCQTDYHNLPAFSEQKQLQVVILTPAGSNHPQAYDPEKKTFNPELVAGQAAKINFLPFPGNFGFIPSTAYHPSGTAGPGEPLAALVLAESQPTGTVQEVIPIATVLLEAAGEKKPIVLAVPARPSEQVITATDFTEFSQHYPVVKEILQKWFVNHNSSQKIKFGQWQDEKEAEKLIRRWLK